MNDVIKISQKNDKQLDNIKKERVKKTLRDINRIMNELSILSQGDKEEELTEDLYSNIASISK